MKTKAINLGRIWSKYLIVEILFYGTVKDAMEDSSLLLWNCGQRHREFLSTNKHWYEKLLIWRRFPRDIKDQSIILETLA